MCRRGQADRRQSPEGRREREPSMVDAVARAVTRRQIVVQTAGLAPLGVLASACGGSPAAQSQGVPTPSRPTGTVEFWQNWATRTPQLRVYLDQFEQQNPGVKVLDTDMATVGGRPKAVAAILAGTVPDCLMVFKDMYALVVPAK